MLHYCFLRQDAHDGKACNWLDVPWLFVCNRLADVSDVFLSMVIAYVIDDLHVVVYLARAFGILGSAF